VFMVMFMGRTLVFYSLSPYYGALGLVVVALCGCVLAGLLGVSFMALILVLIYMGGMLVVFVYSTAISAERYPAVSRSFNELGGLFFFVIIWVFVVYDSFLTSRVVKWVSLNSPGLTGRGELYGSSWFYLLWAGYILLVALMVALIITYGSNYKILKAL